MRSTPFVLALMAACAGVVDLWALTSFGAFAGVITGNLVTAGGAAGSLRLGELLAPLVAVAGFGLGVAAWSAFLRRSVLGALIAELVVLVALAVAWPFGVPARSSWRRRRSRWAGRAAPPCAVLLDVLWWAVPIMAVVLLLVAVAARLLGQERQQRQERDADEHGARDGAEQGPQEGEPLR